MTRLESRRSVVGIDGSRRTYPTQGAIIDGQHAEELTQAVELSATAWRCPRDIPNVYRPRCLGNPSLAVSPADRRRLIAPITTVPASASMSM